MAFEVISLKLFFLLHCRVFSIDGCSVEQHLRFLAKTICRASVKCFIFLLLLVERSRLAHVTSCCGELLMLALAFINLRIF